MLGTCFPTTLFKTTLTEVRLHSAGAMADLVRYEQLRSDRSEQAFSLLTFDFTDRVRFERAQSALEDILVKRVRVTDRAGLMGDSKLGVVLPYTRAAGAWTLADELRPRLVERGGSVICDVFEYPSVGAVGEGNHGSVSVPMDVPTEHQALLTRAEHNWKNVLDITGAVIGLIATAPIIGAAALVIRLTSPGPVIFRQQREGRFGKPFTIYKLRTMQVNAEDLQASLRETNEQDGPAFKMSNDPRVTAVGRLLRITSVDELPQFWNVLRREMSLVGPRPLPAGESHACHGWQRRRLEVLPGMTCIWQVHGRSRVSFEDWIRMDLQYIRSCSFPTDLKILLQTIPAVIFCRGAK